MWNRTFEVWFFNTFDYWFLSKRWPLNRDDLHISLAQSAQRVQALVSTAASHFQSPLSACGMAMVVKLNRVVFLLWSLVHKDLVSKFSISPDWKNIFVFINLSTFLPDRLKFDQIWSDGPTYFTTTVHMLVSSTSTDHTTLNTKCTYHKHFM